MAKTLEQILQDIGGYVDQDASTPTGTDLTTRVNYVNRGLREWADTFDWDVLTKRFDITISYASQASIAMPSNFMKPMSAIEVWHDGTNSYAQPDEYIIVSKAEALKRLSTDKVAYLTGNDADGFSIVIPRGFALGASLAINYKAFPSSLATLSDTTSIPNPDFLVRKGISYVLESRSDPRFPVVKSDADRTLAQMVENENVGNLGMRNQIMTNDTFIIGLDS